MINVISISREILGMKTKLYGRVKVEILSKKLESEAPMPIGLVHLILDACAFFITDMYEARICSTVCSSGNAQSRKELVLEVLEGLEHSVDLHMP